MLRLVLEYSGSYVRGFATAFLISVVAIMCSIVIGTFAALGRTSRYAMLRAVTAMYVATFRGIPPLLSLYLVYFGLPSWAASAELPILLWVLYPLDNRIIAAMTAFTLT